MTTLVFLHIPKTAGQTIHHQLAAAVGLDKVSPIRTHTQAGQSTNLPQGYGLHSGHIDWTDLEALGPDRFAFTVLRDPRERLASFYFFLQQTARDLPPEELDNPLRPEMRAILEMSAEDYFFSGDAARQFFIRNHYDNFFCSYFATRKMIGLPQVRDLSQAELISRAKVGMAQIDGIYWTDGLHELERDMKRKFGLRIHVAERRANKGPLPQNQLRWPKLMERFETDGGRAKLEAFVESDLALLEGVRRPAPPSLWQKLSGQLLASISR